MLCKKCNSPMKHTLRFVNGKSLELEICPKCHAESKPVPIKYDKYQRRQIEDNPKGNKWSENKSAPKKPLKKKKK